MPFPLDPGYGPNGERLSPVGLVSWDANPPPKAFPAVDEVWWIWALGETTVPMIAPLDDEGLPGVYLGGV